MSLSEDLQKLHESGDFGNALEEHINKAKKLEDTIAEHNDLAKIMGAMTVQQMYRDYRDLLEKTRTHKN